MPRTRHHSGNCSPGCAVEATLRLIDGKWKGVILYHLLEGTLRFNEIRRRLASVTQRMLTNQLREMEADGLIARKVYAEVPPKVEYSLTERGRTLEPVIHALKVWGDLHADLHEADLHDPERLEAERLAEAAPTVGTAA
ncbi:helix-turn-helix transcriptional regulator [Methylobacterium sp. WL64]|uniref:winged helix-turn-helix transcriptional regulator n=1 Tax=Methylobacterium sp. WL64 TaxID=2603894 RepID=UPI0011CB05E5|nr:helix-turn-helix domain-containing protein [Methylobacterium sp. WL64]TXN00886.1 helix-turn-helix transcriptional regulator [Methylobacterium sp. WL64]